MRQKYLLALLRLRDSMKQNNIFFYNFLVTVTSSIISEPKHNHVVSSLVTIAAAYGCK
mgnify:FL=1